MCWLEAGASRESQVALQVCLQGAGGALGPGGRGLLSSEHCYLCGRGFLPVLTGVCHVSEQIFLLFGNYSSSLFLLSAS